MTPLQMIEVTRLIGEYDVLDMHGDDGWIDLYMQNNSIVRIHRLGQAFWRKNDLAHRDDGPAHTFGHSFGRRDHNRWFLNGEEMTEAEHARRTKEG